MVVNSRNFRKLDFIQALGSEHFYYLEIHLSVMECQRLIPIVEIQTLPDETCLVLFHFPWKVLFFVRLLCYFSSYFFLLPFSLVLNLS